MMFNVRTPESVLGARRPAIAALLALLALASCTDRVDEMGAPAGDGPGAAIEDHRGAAIDDPRGAAVDLGDEQLAIRDIEALASAAASLPMPSVATSADYAVEYDSIQGGHASARDMDLCELAYLYDGGAGLYRVERIVGRSEEASGPNGPHRSGHTYVQLALEEDWSGFAPERPIVRISGGPESASVVETFEIGLRRGERVGMFLFSPLPGENRGYYRTDAVGVFRDTGRGLTNGQLFTTQSTTAAELGGLVSELYEGLPRVVHRPPWRRLEVPRDRCPHNVLPDAHRHSVDLDALRAQETPPETLTLDSSRE